MTIAYWAHVDAEGRIVSWGQNAAEDVFLQELGAGLTAVGRPPEVTGWASWRYVNDGWVLENEG